MALRVVPVRRILRILSLVIRLRAIVLIRPFALSRGQCHEVNVGNLLLG